MPRSTHCLYEPDPFPRCIVYLVAQTARMSAQSELARVKSQGSYRVHRSPGASLAFIVRTAFEGDRTAEHSRGADLHDDTGGERSGLASSDGVRRYRQPDR
jgi:hypothetical protein